MTTTLFTSLAPTVMPLTNRQLSVLYKYTTNNKKHRLSSPKGKALYTHKHRTANKDRSHYQRHK